MDSGRGAIDQVIQEREPDEGSGDPTTALWLTQLRWIAIAGQLIAIGFVRLVLDIPLAIPQLLMLVLLMIASNIALWIVAKRSANGNSIRNRLQSQILGAVLLFDVAILTGLLYFTGGAANPFILFYVANIAVAGVVLPRSWAIMISAASVLGCFLLLNTATPVGVFAGSPYEHGATWGVTKWAFWISFATCSCVLTYFVSQLALEVRLRDRRLAIAEKDKERAQRLEALATLAAGAGHELASPLSTIAVIAGELSRTLNKPEIPEKVKRDFGLIREELAHCKDILHRMKSGAGEAAAERLHPVTLREIIEETIDAMREPQRVELRMEKAVAEFKAMLPKQALSQALRNLLQNGLDASEPAQAVILNSNIERNPNGAQSWQLIIDDQGAGLSDEVLRRIGEPFFTTKEVGKGMGMGVFLTRNVIQGIGGSIRFERRSPCGTRCIVEIPIGES
ncbi:MAG: ATP-binding protein [Planctomycetaceae bacterium]|jgi:two-component system sensor histidine kinase RegB|nr:ATP-binding protein [Planctomycetaceae bacterium]